MTTEDILRMEQENKLCPDCQVADYPKCESCSPDNLVKYALGKEDYIYCETCKMFVDYWKYDHDIADAGHEGCQWRFVTDEELAGCIQDCLEAGCFSESML